MTVVFSISVAGFPTPFAFAGKTRGRARFEDLPIPGLLLVFVASMEIVRVVLDPLALILAFLLPEHLYVGFPVPPLIFPLFLAGGRSVPLVIPAPFLGVSVGHSFSPAFMVLAT
jgi:hypothetical protein